MTKVGGWLRWKLHGLLTFHCLIESWWSFPDGRSHRYECAGCNRVFYDSRRQVKS